MRLAPIVLLFLTVPATAQLWDKIGTSDAGTTFIDTTSVRPQGQYIKAWFHTLYETDQTDVISGKPYRGYRSLVYADCKAGNYATKQYALYPDEVGDKPMLRSQNNLDVSLVFADPFPGTIGSLMLQRTCAKR